MMNDELCLENTLFEDYGMWIKSVIDNNLNDGAYIRYKDMHDGVCRAADNAKFFASIIIRTQGKREVGLREALLCLSAQTCRDFEVLIMLHKVNSEQAKVVKDIVDSQEPWLYKRIRCIEVSHGNRTTPLNYGLAHARSEYVMILDDDDIVFDNWVETFKDAADKSPGKVIHGYIFSQDWSAVKYMGSAGLRAEHAPEPRYCVDYVTRLQVTTNRCPPLSLAFPISAFEKMGLIFDESLNTQEDWDYLMRVSILTGVFNVQEAVGIYRNWINLENSHTVHAEGLWESDYRTIINRLLEYKYIINSDDFDKVEVRRELSDRDQIVHIVDKHLKEGTLSRKIATAIYRTFLRGRHDG